MNPARKISGLDKDLAPLGLGTWVMNGFHWGDAEDAALEQTIEECLAAGVHLIDTAPVYGFGRAEQTIGRVLKRLGKRDQIVLATKFGLEWDDRFSKIGRNCSKKNLMRELDKSRKRLQTDVIDLYQVHWPDPRTEMGETMDALLSFYDAGIIRAIGVSNFTVDQLIQAMRYAPLHACQLPFNLFEQGAALELIPFCRKKDISVLAYSPLCRGLLSGKFKEGTLFSSEDIRGFDPKFRGQGIQPYLKAVDALGEFARLKKCTVSQLALSWVFSTSGVCVALAGARSRAQAACNAAASHVRLSDEECTAMASLVMELVPQAGAAMPENPNF